MLKVNQNTSELVRFIANKRKALDVDEQEITMRKVTFRTQEGNELATLIISNNEDQLEAFKQLLKKHKHGLFRLQNRRDTNSYFLNEFDRNRFKNDCRIIVPKQVDFNRFAKICKPNPTK